MKTLKPSKWGLFKSYFWVAFFILILGYAIFSSRFAWAWTTGDERNNDIIQDVIVVVICLVIDVVLWFILIHKNYYEIIKTGIVHHKIGGETSYTFDNVIYINEEYSVKHKTLNFYNEKGKELFLTLDKDQELLCIFKKECKNVLTKEEFKEKFPKIKL